MILRMHMNGPERFYRVSEFATATGVTVRTLHHYDRIGLLKPSCRTESGYRLYGRADLERLQQIVALKFVGFPLNQIKDLLDRRPIGVLTALRMQRMVISGRLEQLRHALSAIEAAESQAQQGGTPDAESLKKIIEVMEMPNDPKWMEKYYDEAALAEHKKQWNPAMQEEVTREWTELIAEVESSLHEDPAGAHAQSLAQRWNELVGRFTQGKPQIEGGLKKLYADQKNWPSDFKKPYSDEASAFIRKATEAGLAK
jgi:MerR family transcriptional regulator, thiopeptide resistance regulator